MPTGNAMKKKQFVSERKYLLSMHFVKTMESQKMLTKEEAEQVRKALSEKYKPIESAVNPYVT